MSTLCLRYCRVLRPVIIPSVALRGVTHYNHPYFKQKFVPIEQQSHLLQGSDYARSSRLLPEDSSELVSSIPGAPDVKTVFDCLKHGLKVSNDGDCIGKKVLDKNEYQYSSYSNVIARSKNIGSALIELGIKPCKDSFVGVFASNREEFFLTFFASSGYSMVLVPLYETLGLQSVLFVINQACLSHIIVHNSSYVSKILENASQVPSLKTMILMEGITPDLMKTSTEKNIHLMSFSQLEEIGQKNTKELVLPSSDDVFAIPYTSGTTGVPKGVMLTHKNIITCIASLAVGYGKAGLFGGTIVSYLPPAHIYEICNQVASMYFARRMAFYHGDIKNLMAEVRIIKPTILPLVPRLMNALYVKEMERYKGRPIKSLLLKIALDRKKKMLMREKVTNRSIWDKLVFKEFQAQFEENILQLFTTSAPVPPDVMSFFRCASGCYIFEVYGQTEVLAATMTLPFEYNGGSVGPPLPCNYVKLADVPEMNYFAKDGVGEICFKGPNVFQGYYKNPAATAESIIDGWQYSGDIGRWNKNGCLQVIDRKKHLFKLSQGEYIAPEKVENVYSHSHLVLQIFVDGLSNQNYVVTLIVPEINALKEWLKKKGFSDTGDMKQLLQTKEVRKAFLEELHNLGKKEDLNPLEQARNLAFHLEPFTIANDLMTPTLKIRRNHARKLFEPVLLKLYEEGPLIQTLKLQK